MSLNGCMCIRKLEINEINQFEKKKVKKRKRTFLTFLLRYFIKEIFKFIVHRKKLFIIYNSFFDKKNQANEKFTIVFSSKKKLICY
jgi:hypothetical protein